MRQIATCLTKSFNDIFFLYTKIIKERLTHRRKPGKAIAVGIVFDRPIPAVVSQGLKIFWVAVLLLDYGCTIVALYVIRASIFRDDFFPATQHLEP